MFDDIQKSMINKKSHIVHLNFNGNFEAANQAEFLALRE